MSKRVGSKASDFLDDIRQQYVECASCSKEYNDHEKCPRILPCLHALCESCLQSTASRGAVKCPTCDTRHGMPNGDIGLFRKDTTREYLMSFMKVHNKNSDIPCQECDVKSRRASHRCRECSQFLCSDCNDAHRRTKVTKRHNISALDDLQESSLEDFQVKHTCNVSGHEYQPYAFYCHSESCDRPVCALCAVSDHPESRGHDIREIGEVYNETKRTVEGLMSDVKHRTLSAQDTAATIESTINNLDSGLENVAQQIDVAFDNCVRALERRRTDLKDQTHAKVKEKKKRLDNQLDSLTFHINSMEDATEFATTVANYGNTAEFLFLKDTVVQRLNVLRDEEFDTVPHDNDELKFKLNNMADDFYKHAKEMGEVWATSAYAPNSHVQVNDVMLDREQTAMHITLFDSEGLQQTEGGVDVRVEVTDPEGRRRPANIEDQATTEGTYKALYIGASKGKHRATIFLHGTPMPEDQMFRVVTPSPGGIDRLTLRDKFAGADSKADDSRPMQTATPSEMSHVLSPITDYMLGDIICPGFVFDATTSNQGVEILEEGKTMRAKASKGKNTQRTARGEPGRLQVYRGAMASRPIQKTGLYYFEVGVVYKIHTLVRQELVFEVGLSKLDCMDKHHTVDCHPYAWSVSARGCHVCGKVCLQTWHNGQLLSHTVLSARTKSTPGTFVRVYYGFLLDAERRHWIVVDVKNKKLLFRFTNLVVSEMSEPLWPVFSVAPPDVVSVALTLKTGRTIDNIPEEALEALAP